VGPAYDALKADPSRPVSTKQIRARLATEHKKMEDKKRRQAARNETV
jgi:hypothetical protein